MRFVSWNVNGIRAVLKKDFINIAKKFKADFICLQETKAPGGPVLIGLDGYEEYWNHAEKKGYSGTLILSKKPAIKVTNDMGIAKHDQEGRVIAAEYEDFYLVNVYVPNAKRGLERLPYRHKEWDVDFLKYLKKLEKKKPVIVCGDFNVAHTAIDLARPKGNEKTHGFTVEEREGMTNFIEAGIFGYVSSF